MDHGESICTVEIRKQYAPEPFFFSPARWLLDIHQQITISISEVGREEGQGIVESESQKKKERENKKDGQNCQNLCRSHWVDKSLVTFEKNSFCKVAG